MANNYKDHYSQLINFFINFIVDFVNAKHRYYDSRVNQHTKATQSITSSRYQLTISTDVDCDINKIVITIFGDRKRVTIVGSGDRHAIEIELTTDINDQRFDRLYTIIHDWLVRYIADVRYSFSNDRRRDVVERFNQFKLDCYRAIAQ